MTNNEAILYNTNESDSGSVVASNSSYENTTWKFYNEGYLTLIEGEFNINFTVNGTDYIGIKSEAGELYYKNIDNTYIKVFERLVASA
jgi:hypothetical protein